MSTKTNTEVHWMIEVVHTITKFPRLYKQSGYRCR